MSAFGPERTCASAPHMSAFGGKADIAVAGKMSAFDQKRTLMQVGQALTSHAGPRDSCNDRSEELMKPHVTVIAAAMLAGATGAVFAASEVVTMNAIDANGVGKKIGTLRLSDTKSGLEITPQLTSLPAGNHGFHVHVNPNCGSGPGPNGQPAAGLAAGGHYDPANTGKHLGPLGEGHKGDMPLLTVDASGKATKTVIAPHLTVADVKGRSVMIHAGGDNYSDQPAPLGGGGGRIACGVVR
jgi:superoxide dismutase, Cu-Zn family